MRIEQPIVCSKPRGDVHHGNHNDILFLLVWCYTSMRTLYTPPPRSALNIPDTL